MKTIVASVYAINPFKGSEDGMGWNFVCQIARFNKVIAITRKNNRENIENYIRKNPNVVYENMQFVYFDLPKWAMFWKRGSKGALLYFYLWQRFLPTFIKKQKLEFDILHNVNFHNDWTPSFLWKLNKPLVWGPIGHHPGIPSKYLSKYKWTYKIKELVTKVVKLYFWNFSFALKKTRAKASHIFCMNSYSQKTLGLFNTKSSITPSVACEDNGFEKDFVGEKFTIVSVGRLVPLKGFDLSIISFSAFLKALSAKEKQKCELIIVGSGPELKNYEALVNNLGISDYVVFKEWMDRTELMKLYKKSSAFLFPSHEGAGMVVAEALSFGLPVICLDNCGPGEFVNSNCGIKVSYNNYNQTIKELSAALSNLFWSPETLYEMRLNARRQYENYFQWDKRGEEFRKVYIKLA